MRQLLKFGKGNAKLGKNVYTFSLPAGFTCPGANECLSKANRETGKIKDGPEMKFRCFAATSEMQYPNVRKSRWHNFDNLDKLSRKNMYELISFSLPKKADIIRIHVSGDFFNEQYFLAWMDVAKAHSNIRFYFYTKMANFLVKYRKEMPINLVGTYSLGGKMDSLATENTPRFAKVVYSEQEAKDLDLEIDHDDTHAMVNGKSFALLIHGTQPKGSAAAKAKAELKGVGSYSGRKSLTILPSVV